MADSEVTTKAFPLAHLAFGDLPRYAFILVRFGYDLLAGHAAVAILLHLDCEWK